MRGRKIPDPLEFSKAMAHLAERSQRIVADFLTHQTGDGLGMADPATSPAPSSR